MKYDVEVIQRLTACMLLGLVVLSPQFAWASTLDTELSSGMCKVVNALTGRTGRAIASIGIIILGIGSFFGKVNWGLAITVAVGITAIFSSMQIAQALSGGTGSC